MPRIWFQNINVSVQSTGIIAESASVSTRNALEPIRTIGRIGVINQAPFGPLISTFNFSYFPELDREPNFATAETIKNLTGDYLWSGLTLAVGGITGSGCYLQNYSLEAQPNDTVRATASYVSFRPLLGVIAQKTGDIGYNRQNAVAHGWTVHVTDSGNSLDTPTYSFGYGLGASWEPTYVGGRTDPVQVNLMDGSETVSFTKDVAKFTLHSGEDPSLYLGSTGIYTGLDMLNVLFVGGQQQGLAAITLSLSGYKITQSSVSAGLDDFVKANITATKGF